MVSGSVGFAPNPADGLIFLFEPSRGLAATILQNTDELSSPPMRAHAVRDRRRAAVLGGDAVAGRLGGEAADEALLTSAGGGMSAIAAPFRAPAAGEHVGRPSRAPPGG